MDHQEFAQLLGNYGEFVGAIAVVITLGYLAVQIRHNSLLLDRSNQQADATSIYESQYMYSQCFAQLAQDGDLAEIYSRMLAGEQLERAEYVRATAFITTYFIWMEKVFLQANENVGYAGLKDVGDVVQFFSVPGPYVVELLETASGRKWWAEEAPKQFMAEFRAAVDAYVAQAVLETESDAIAE